MKPPIQIFNDSPCLKGWKELLAEWVKMIELSDRGTSARRDVGYWYGERALTGLLAAAAWKTSGWSLEEWTARRGRGRSEGAAKGDLWLEIGSGKFTIEAKVSWPSTSWETAISYAKNRLEAAEDQLRKLDREYRHGKPLALCYIVPQIACASKYDNDETIDGYFINIASIAEDFDIAAAYRPKRYPEWGGRKYPGVILVGWLLDRELKWK